jgi:uncharacterized protein (TIGR02145 family)
MKINPRYIKLSAAVVASLISACSLELETPTDEKGVPTYTNKLSELYEIECNAERAGSKVFVNFEQMTFECDGTQWNGAYAGQDSTNRVIAPIVDRNFNFGSVTDARDGQTYKTIKIGNQNWLAQNLNYDTFDSWCFDATTNCAKDGRYYSWYGAMDIDESTWSTTLVVIENEHQGACPEGWHVPTISEWEELFAFVAGTSDYKQFEDSVAYKLRSNFGWEFNMNGWDVYGFALTPNGYYDRVLDFEVTQKTTSIYQWTATPGDGYRTHSRYFEMTDDMILIGPSYDNKSAMTVRCVENTTKTINTPIDTPVDTPIDTPVDTPVDTPIDTPVDTPIGPTGDVVSCNMEISMMGVTTSSCDEYAAGSATAEAAVAQCVSVEGYLTATLGNGCPANYTKKCIVNDEAIVYFYEEENANQDCSDLITAK